MSVLDELQATVATQRAILSALEPGCLSGPDALRLLEVFTAIERLAAAGRTLVAKRVEESNVWRASGDRSAAHFIAQRTGTSVGRTQAALETAERLAKLPATAEAFRAGALSEVQAEAGEACEIEGLGPVPVAVVESWRHDAYLRLIVTDGIDVKAITRRSRYVDAHLDAALAVRDRHCVVTGCDVDWRLERDHRVPYAQCHTTSLDGLGRMCWWHHLLKTKGWALVGGPGCYRLTPPGSDPPDAVEHGGRAPPLT